MANNYPNSQFSNGGFNKKIIAGGLATVVVIGIIGGVVFNSTKKTENKSNSSSSSVTVSTDISTNNVSSNANNSSNSNSSAQTNFTQSTDEIDKGREEVQAFQSATKDFNPVSYNFVAIDSKLAKEIATKVGNVPAPIKVPEGKKVRLNISYSSIGDQQFDNATLTIKLTKGLKLVSGSMEDTFKGDKKTVTDSVYSEKDNLILYGPGTGSSKTSRVDVGDKGSFSLTVELKKDAEDYEQITSYMADEKNTDRIGKPAVFPIAKE